MANNDERIVLSLDVSTTAKQLNSDLKKLQSKLNTVSIETDIDASGAQKSMNKLKKTWSSLGNLGLVPKNMDILVSQLRRIPGEVIKVNTAMTELKKTSSTSVSEINDYFEKATGSAKRFGTSVSSMINAAAKWSKAGYSLPDSKKLAEAAALYANIGSNITMNSANEALTSTLQGCCSRHKPIARTHRHYGSWRLQKEPLLTAPFPLNPMLRPYWQKHRQPDLTLLPLQH